jgi:hypothetical protein
MLAPVVDGAEVRVGGVQHVVVVLLVHLWIDNSIIIRTWGRLPGLQLPFPAATTSSVTLTQRYCSKPCAPCGV